MLRKIGYGLAALGVVLVCSTEARAQQQHGQYRGQVVTMLRQLGAPGVSTDLIRFHHARAAGGS